MDFTLLHEHPWATVGIIAGGGLLLFVVFRRGSGGAVPAGTITQSTDPNSIASANALQAQQDQISGGIQGLSIQGQTQIALATIAGNVQGQTVTATQDVTNRQTDAQLQLGMGTLAAQVATTQIQAQVQMNLIDSLVRAFTGSGVTGGGGVNNNIGGYNSNPVINSPGNPIVTYTPPVNVASAPPIVPPSYNTNTTGWPTRQQFGLDPNGGGFHCSPLDPGCVANQNTAGNAYDLAVANAQVTNNINQQLANYQISVDAGVITPAQLAAMQTLQGGTTQTQPHSTRTIWDELPGSVN